MPLWCLLSNPAQVHGKCDQRATWGGAPVEEDGIDDAEADEEDYGDGDGPDEGRGRGQETGRFGDGE